MLYYPHDSFPLVIGFNKIPEVKKIQLPTTRPKVKPKRSHTSRDELKYYNRLGQVIAGLVVLIALVCFIIFYL